MFRRIVVFAFVLVILGPGCVELGLIPPPDGSGPTPGGGGNGGGTPPEEIPRVRLTASNTTPQVNEELILRCRTTNAAGDDVDYGFQAGGGVTGRLQVDSAAGTARFIVQESDVGVAVSVTCTGTNELGTGPASSAVVIVASSPPPDPVVPP